MKPTLYIFAGLPGSGKTTLARKLVQKKNAAYLRIDTIEQAINDCCAISVDAEGYCLVYKIAGENLSLGISVVVDSCNPVTETRNAFEGIARDCNSDFMNIEILCSDTLEHKSRIESRSSNAADLNSLTWQDVLRREYHAWDRDRLAIDTAAKSVSDAFHELYIAISRK